jgi:glutamine amidotransferase
VKPQTVAVVDYEMGNLYSVVQALRTAAQGQPVEIVIAQSPEVITRADRIVLPGQGAMPACMAHLQRLGLDDALRHALQTKPVLGVCVGMQMLLDRSEEGHVPTLGWIPGEVKRLSPVNQSIKPDGSAEVYKIPHMGWNQVHIQDMSHPLWQGIAQDSYFYFVHSFAAYPRHLAHQAAHTQYSQTFCSAVLKDHVFATQFHPEKSATAGLQLYRNFLTWMP